MRTIAIGLVVVLVACGKDEPKPPPPPPATPDAAVVAKPAEPRPPSALLTPPAPDAAAAVDSSGLKTTKQEAASNELVQDDAAFTAALKGTMLRAYVEGSSGYSRYAYNFLADGQLLYCSYYYMVGQGGGTAESNQVGTWKVTAGFKVPSVPGYTAGKIRITGSGFDAVMAAEMLDAKAGVATGNMSSTFYEGTFSRAVNGAVTSCSAIE